MNTYVRGSDQPRLTRVTLNLFQGPAMRPLNRRMWDRRLRPLLPRYRPIFNATTQRRNERGALLLDQGHWLHGLPGANRGLSASQFRRIFAFQK